MAAVVEEVIAAPLVGEVAQAPVVTEVVQAPVVTEVLQAPAVKANVIGGLIPRAYLRAAPAVVSTLAPTIAPSVITPSVAMVTPQGAKVIYQQVAPGFTQTAPMVRQVAAPLLTTPVTTFASGPTYSTNLGHYPIYQGGLPAAGNGPQAVSAPEAAPAKATVTKQKTGCCR